MGSGLILGIESSCDETAAAVVRGGREVLSNVVASQMALHARYGGVVPELASREHLRNIVPVVREAIGRAGVQYEDLDAIAVTEGPGLAGALLVGITFAKALAFGCGRPLIGVNHLEGHIHAVLMEAGAEMEGPLLALVVSGGHTHLYVAESSVEAHLSDGETVAKVGHRELSEAEPPFQGRGVGDPAGRTPPDCDEIAMRMGHPVLWRYRNVGRTVDDAAGEAFDKVAKLLGLGYPGGPWIDRLAKFGDAKAVPFTFGGIRTRAEKSAYLGLKETMSQKRGFGKGHPGAEVRFDFSFSGIKTAVLRYVETRGMWASVEARRKALAAEPGMSAEEVAELCDGGTLDLIASFQGAVMGNLLRQSFRAAEAFAVRGIVVSGGVAANGELRARFVAEGARRGLGVAFPSVGMSTDNAAMIAAAAWPKFVAGEFAGEGMGAVPGLRLG